MNPWIPTETSVEVKGKGYPVTIVSNTTIDQIVATTNTLHFRSSGPTGEMGYINVIFPMVNTTEIKVFIDGGPPLTPPPFPVINTNGTHYFIYFEFTLSTHTVAIQFAPTIVTAIIDIDPDTLNLISQGQWITAYIQLSEGHDAEDINATTISFNGTISPVLDPKYDFVTNSSEYIVDHDGDEVLERMVKFNRTEIASWIHDDLGIEYGDVILKISGKLYGGTPFEGTDIIRVLFPGDADDDGYVGSADAGILNGAYGTNSGNLFYVPEADFDEDGYIGSADAGILNGNYGKTALQ
jgi:hypothetical protein